MAINKNLCLVFYLLFLFLEKNELLEVPFNNNRINNLSIKKQFIIKFTVSKSIF